MTKVETINVGRTRLGETLRLVAVSGGVSLMYFDVSGDLKTEVVVNDHAAAKVCVMLLQRLQLNENVAREFLDDAIVSLEVSIMDGEL